MSLCLCLVLLLHHRFALKATEALSPGSLPLLFLSLHTQLFLAFLLLAGQTTVLRQDLGGLGGRRGSTRGFGAGVWREDRGAEPGSGTRGGKQG